MGKMGCWGLKKEEQNYISDVWEKWGGHIWGNGVLGILLKERIRFLTYGRNGVATYGEKGCWGFYSDMWEKWGRHIWGKGELGITKKNLEEPRAATEIGEV
jgi:hypothetical protein